MDGIVRQRLRFHGWVQGVGFRYRARHAARFVGATGWVRNEPDGTVSMELQGTQAQIDRVVQMVGAGHYVQIDAVDAKSIPLQPDERSFSVLSDFWDE